MKVYLFISNVHAKQLMNQNESLMDSIKSVLVKNPLRWYAKSEMDRKHVFDDATALNDLNNLVHPVVQKTIWIGCLNKQRISSLTNLY